MIRTHEKAVEMLAYAPACTDAAVDKLTELAKRERTASLYSDLAGAHLVRARRDDRPSDYARALWAAEEALKLDGRLPQARFNAALAAEGIGFSDEAARLWTSLSHDAPGNWKTEAREHNDHLDLQHGRERALQWRLNLDRLGDALDDPDPAALENVISPFRNSAQNYVEEELLRDWALASTAGKTVEAGEKLAIATRIAKVLRKLNHDTYLSDAVNLVRTARDPRIAIALRDGHIAFANARTIQRNLAAGDPEIAYAAAADAFKRAGSPLRYGAMLGQITVLTQRRLFNQALLLLRTVDRNARRHAYHHVHARTYTARGYLFAVQGSHFQSLAEYTKALKIYETTQDAENLGIVQSRHLGELVEIGSVEDTWHAVFLSHRYPSADLNSRHVVLGETSRLAVSMGYLGIGLRFQDAAVRLFEDELRQNRDERLVPQLRGHLGIALRARASIRARLNDRDGARADLAQAIPLIGQGGNPKDAAIPIGFGARLAEAEAHMVAENDRRSAIALLERAIRDVSQTHYRTLLASLHLQRAELEILEGDRPAELRDVYDAVEALRAETESLIDAKPERIPPDRLWVAYFSGRQEAYRRLIRLLVEGGDEKDAAEAFNHAEESRAYEPLHVLRQRGLLPPEFKAIRPDGRPLRLAEVERVVPEGTYLLQYCVLDDRTYVWIVGHGDSKRLTLNVGNDAIAEWSAALQKYADRRADAEFQSVLNAPYDALLRKPLDWIAQRDGGTSARIVIVPDRDMHGLPFAALKDGPQYVIRKHRLAVAASASLYAFSLIQDRALRTSYPGSVLLLGKPAFDTTQQIARGLEPDVPGLRVDRIADLYAPLARVRTLAGGDATVPRFLQSAPEGGVIHIAAHGIANPDNPSKSYFLLAPAEDDAGALDAERLLRDLRLQKTRLAVLAACSSAAGTAVGPDGIAPLVRPIVLTGVPGVIGTLWNISAHQETEELLLHFHRHYSQGEDADEALQHAQLDMLDDEIASRKTPRAWAAFQMIGFASSPFPASDHETRRTKP